MSVDGRTPVPAAKPTVVFTATEVGGESGCNHYGGQYRYDGATGRIAFDQLRMTAMACAEAARNTFETLFTQALGQGELVSSATNGRIVISGPAGRILLAAEPL
jgi:heat shock protein HslJ